jgi:hypothetical protein
MNDDSFRDIIGNGITNVAKKQKNLPVGIKKIS